MIRRGSAAGPGIGLHVYPNAIVHESRLLKLSRSLQETDLFTECHLVGTAAADVPREESLGGGRKIRRLGRAPRPGESTLGKAYRMLAWYVSVLAAYAGRPVTSVSAHNVWVLPVCWVLAKRTGAVLAYNPHELETESITMRGVRKLLAQVMEHVFMRRARVVCVVNDPIAEWYREHRRSVPPITVRNVPAPATPGQGKLRAELDIAPRDLLYVHTGHLIEGRSIKAILGAFKESPSVHVVFMGEGPLGGEVREAVDRYPNIHWVPPVPSADVVATIRDADAALVLIEPLCLSYRLASPNKLFEALAAGLPPLSIDLPAARGLLGDTADTWVIAPDGSITDALARITRSDIDAFHASWSGLPSWEDEVAPLVDAYREQLR